MGLMTINKLAREISNKSLFSRGGTVTQSEALELMKGHRFKYCTGKYTDKVISRDFDGLVWYERRKDADGPYVMLFTVHDRPETTRIRTLCAEDSR